MDDKKNDEAANEISKTIHEILEEALELSEIAEEAQNIPHKYPEVHLELSNTHIHMLKIDFDDLYPLECIDQPEDIVWNYSSFLAGNTKYRLNILPRE